VEKLANEWVFQPRLPFLNECKFKASVVSTTDKKRDWGPSVEILMLTPEPKGEFSFFPPSFFTGHEGNMGEIGRSMKKMEICRKKSMMKIMIAHHFAGIPKGRRSYRCFFFLTT